MERKDDQQLDRSAGEAGEPADMDYYKATNRVKGGSAVRIWAIVLLAAATLAVATLWFVA